ncbi:MULTISPECIES: flagellin [unclassified Haematospirillum]|uniref:flagellin N-terminal helical domain-containing protein n=1 Tax=unclassified Haematospirillum TaxID=2622088 RepID=UPI00143B75CC|nr:MULTISPECIES: flagellin [unclassified Haematospirillum]NKD55312.1 flagellin [Haematospirillum sp. H4890]NKD75531.1 flagellin [Haematospirillum sp. H4485]NKD88385.1 flagellin [Haematospirillum sp. 15-248]
MADISLTASSRANLLSLQYTQSLVNRTQGRLSTGKAVSSVIDDALKYFQAKSLSDRSRDLSARKDSIDQGINALKVVVETTERLEQLANQMRGIVNSSRTATKEQRQEFTSQLGSLAWQIQKLVDDTSYQGQNLLNSSAAKLTVYFSEKADSKLEINGLNFNASRLFRTTLNGILSMNVSKAGLGITVLKRLGFTAALSSYNLSVAPNLASYNNFADKVTNRLERTIDNVRAKAASFGGAVAILQVRLDFTKNYTNILSEGSDKLVLADLNEEGANLLALQTRQQLGIQALSFAGQSEQSVLQLFR